MSDVACCKGECCGPGSYCCQHAGPHTHEEDATPHDDEAPPSPIRADATDYPSEEELAEITSADLDEVERLDKAATPGPWIVNRFDCEGGAINWQVQQLMDPAEVIANVTDDEPRRARHDARLICLARSLLPRVVRAYRALQGAHDASIIDAYNRGRADEKVLVRDAYARGRHEATTDFIAWLKDKGYSGVVFELQKDAKADKIARGGK